MSLGAGNSPRWRADGRELYYAGAQSEMVVPVFAGADFTVGPATALPFLGTASVTLAQRLGFIDASADGKRFLYARPVEIATARAPVNVLLNWTPPDTR